MPRAPRHSVAVDLAVDDPERAPDYLGEGGEGVLRATGVEGPRAQAGQPGDLVRAAARRLGLGNRAGHELARHGGCRKKGHERSPVERLTDRELVVRELEEVVDGDDAAARE